LVYLLWPLTLAAQNNGGGDIIINEGDTGGVYIDAQATLRHRQVEPGRELAAMRQRLIAAGKHQSQPGQVSLKQILQEARKLADAGKPLTDELRCLGGLTQLRYVLVYPRQQDLVLVGPAEPVDASNRLQPVGRITGRPLLQLDDLAVALRTVQDGKAFGCSIDLPADALQKMQRVLQDSAKRMRRQLMDDIYQSMGPQTVRIFGARADTRLAMACVAADYKLKRIFLGLEQTPVVDLGHAISNAALASQRFWFQTLYEPLRVSADGLAYEIAGQRLSVQTGALSFDPRGATPEALAFAKRMTERLPQLAQAVPWFADLQNIADLSLLAALISQDGLERKSGLDLSWLRQTDGHRVTTVPVARKVDTLVGMVGNQLVAGGVNINPAPWIARDARQTDEKDLPRVWKAHE
jgi:hypothetical protein